METQLNHTFPFSAVIGQEDLKLALLLNSIDPSLGGVLAIGDKGTGKTTLIRSLSALMNAYEPFPFINLPIGASEDRVLGHINLETLINDKKEHIEPGLLAKADNGFLYVDEINLLNDYLTDVLLDAAASGSYHLEREGISTVLNSRFCLIGSMNPEEGDLRPQLKDRFGLSVNVTTPNEIALRTKIIQNRIKFDDNPEQFIKRFIAEDYAVYLKIRAAKAQLKTIELPANLYEKCAITAYEHSVEGLRADILLLKTARAYAAFLGETEITKAHIETIAPFVLNHRSNKSANNKQSPSNKEQSQQDSNPSEGKTKNNQSQPEHTFDSIIPNSELHLKNRSNTLSKNGVDTVLNSAKNKSLGVNSSAEKNIDTHKTIGQYLATNTFELKHKSAQNKTTKHIIFLLDSSGSMAKGNMVAYAKGLIEATITKEKQARLTFSLLSLFDGDVAVIIKKSQAIDELVSKLQDLKTGGKTNVISGFKTIKTIVSNSAEHNELVIITDGRFNSEGINNFDNAITAYQTYCKNINELTIVDAETGVVKLGLAKRFAEKVKGNYELL